MNVRKADRPAEAGYPDAKEFRRQRHLFGVAVIGAGMAMSACAQRTGGVPPPPPPPPQRLGGVAPLVRHTLVANETNRGKLPVTPPSRTQGKIKVEPKEDRPPPPPPRLPGVPPPVR